MADPLLTALRFLHIGAGIAMVGGATLWTVLMGTFQQMGPTLPKGFLGTVGGKVVKFLPNAAGLALLTGALLFWLMMPFGNPTWQALMGVSLLLLVVILGLSHALIVPTFRKLGQAMAALQGPPGPDIAALQAKMKGASMANLAMAWLIVLLMVVATALRTT